MAIHVLLNSIHALRVLLKCVTIRRFTPATRKRFIMFIMTFAYFNLKTRIAQSSFHYIIIFTVVCFKNIIKNIVKNLFSNIALFSVAKCICKVRGKKKLAYVSKFLSQNCVFYRKECFVKTTNQIRVSN